MKQWPPPKLVNRFARTEFRWKFSSFLVVQEGVSGLYYAEVETLGEPLA